jgi:hypothetical protein
MLYENMLSYNRVFSDNKEEEGFVLFPDPQSHPDPIRIRIYNPD